MGRVNSLLVFKRDNLVVDIISRHKGKENVISGRELVRQVNEQGYDLSNVSLHCLITKIKFERHLPICSLNSNGYYWARNLEDIAECVKHLKERVISLNEHIEFLESFIVKSV